MVKETGSVVPVTSPLQLENAYPVPWFDVSVTVVPHPIGPDQGKVWLVPFTPTAPPAVGFAVRLRVKVSRTKFARTCVSSVIVMVLGLVVPVRSCDQVPKW